MRYQVTWEITIFDAKDPLDAAKQAREAQLQEDILLTSFDVFDEEGHFKATVDTETNEVTN